MKRTLGIDLASADATTAACLVAWPDDGAPRLVLLEPAGVTDARIVELAREADVVAIDAPLGWPLAFTDALAAYAAGDPFPELPDRNALWLRATDRHAKERLGGRPPLSVSSDRIARPAARAATLLRRLGPGGPDGRPAARDGTDRVIEAYPAGSLRTWGFSTTGYKRPDATARRAELADAIVGTLGLAIDAADLERLTATDHALDALVASLVGRAFDLGQVHGIPAGLESVAAIEGWLYLPAGTLEALAGR